MALVNASLPALVACSSIEIDVWPEIAIFVINRFQKNNIIFIFKYLFFKCK